MKCSFWLVWFVWVFKLLKIFKKLGIVNSAIKGGKSTLAPRKMACAGKWQTLLFIWVHAWKFVTSCIYDKRLAGFSPVQLPQRGYETLHFSSLVLFLLIMNSFLLPWQFNRMFIEFVQWSSLRLNTYPCTASSKFWNGRATKRVRDLNFMYLKS